MSKLWDLVKDDTKNKADDFIRRIKSNQIVRRTLPKAFIDFPLDQAYKSFQALVDSKEHEESMINYYKK